jgi:pyruvate dehydrogenase E2 component (dihydrolipoamide acetyltransferase)
MSEKVRLSGVRKLVAARMHASLQATAQLTFHAKADVTGLSAVLPRWKDEGRKAGLQDCLFHVLAKALQRHPLLNGTADDDGYTLSDAIDLSVAFSTNGGLVTPVLRALGVLSLDEIAEQRRALTSRALEGKLQVSEMKGGTFTISNLGLSCVEYFTPILNAPQIALLGLGRLGKALRQASDGAIVERVLLPLSLTVDHRIVDGDPAARFLTDLCDMLDRSRWDAL